MAQRVGHLARGEERFPEDPRGRLLKGRPAVRPSSLLHHPPLGSLIR